MYLLLNYLIWYAIDSESDDTPSPPGAKEKDLDEPNKLLMKYCGHAWPREYETEFFVFLCLHEANRKNNYMFSPQVFCELL